MCNWLTKEKGKTVLREYTACLATAPQYLKKTYACKNECDIVSIILVQGFTPLDSVLNDLHNSSDRTQPLPIIAEDQEI